MLACCHPCTWPDHGHHRGVCRRTAWPGTSMTRDPSRVTGDARGRSSVRPIRSRYRKGSCGIEIDDRNVVTQRLAGKIDQVGMVREHQHIAGAGQSVEHLQISRHARILEVDEEIVGNERQAAFPSSQSSITTSLIDLRRRLPLSSLPSDCPDGLHPETG